MKSIVLINCYFGKFPNYFNLFVESCRTNPTINYLFFTDNVIQDLPPNITVINTTFDDIKEKIQSKFDFKISLDAPYKLCDYKPAYGYVFADYVSQYDYWGFCDVDMIFGNVRHFLTDDILDKYDKFYKLGHLTLFKNTQEINTIFMNEDVISYKKAFTTKKIAVFDEYQGVQLIFDSLGKSTYFSRDYADIRTSQNKYNLSDLLVEDYKNNNFANQIFVRENDCVFRYYYDNNMIKKDEFAYIHLQKRKFDKTIDVQQNYLITYNGFIPMKDINIDVACMKKYNGTDYIKEISARYKVFDYRLRRKINKMRTSINEHFTSAINR